MHVVFPLGLLLGLLLGAAAIPADEAGAGEPPDPAASEPADGATAEPVALEPDSTGTRFIAPVQEVYGERPDRARRIDRGTSIATVLESGDWAGKGAHGAELLGRAAGLSVSSTGGLGASASLSLRGSSAAQVPVYLDGVLLNRPDGAGWDAGTMNPQSVERVEVYRGSAPLTLGSASLGGAVHLTSGADAGHVLGAATARSYGGFVFEGGAAGAAGPWTLSLRGRGLRAENDWDFDDDRGTLYNPDDDARVRRVNNDVRAGGGLAVARRPFGAGELGISFLADATEQGLPGYSVRQSETARGRSFLGQVQARWTAPPAAQTRWREVSVHGRVDHQGYRDPGGDLSGRIRDRTDRVLRVGTSATGALSRTGEDAWRVELSQAWQKSEDLALRDGDFPRRERTRAAVALQPALRLFDDRFLVSPGARYEVDLDREEGDGRTTTDARTLQIGARWSLRRDLFVKGNVGHFERVPGLFELFGDRGVVVGNGDLVPESGTNRDLGLVWSSGERRVAVSWFVNDAFDLILPVQISPVAVKYQNLARAEIEGLEVEADTGRLGPFRARAALTRQWTEDRSGRSWADGHPLPGRPALLVDAELNAHAGRWTLSLGWARMAENFAQTGSRARIPDRSIFGASLERGLGDGWVARAAVDNVGDEQVFDLYGYPLPGRQFAVSIQKVR